MTRPEITRRGLFASAAVTLTTAATRAGQDQQQQPTVRNPRATDGDARFEPDWKARLTLTVGPKQGTLIGASDKAIQAALHYVARLGGGTVKLLPGTFLLRNAVWLPSRTRLLGSGEETVIAKLPSETVDIAADSDWYDQEITLSKSAGFRVGDGVTIRVTNPDNGSNEVIKRTLVARSGNRFKLNDGLHKNVWLSGKPTCSSLFPLLTAENAADVVVENLTLDGNRPNNANLNGNYGGCIFLQDCNRFTFRKVEARNYNGDGISFQICHDVVVDDCYCHGNANLGVHPGSGSQRPVIRNSRMNDNDLGLFWCWGVKFGLAANNTMDGNHSYGISIGHNDTDNLMRGNRILNSGKVGVLFRNDTRGQDFWANRNVLQKNHIENSGNATGVAVDIQGKTRDIRLVDNTIVESRGPMKRIGIRIAKEAGTVTLDANQITGFMHDVVDLREA